MPNAGNGATDPQSVAISAHGQKGVYTVGALIGLTTMVVDIDAQAEQGTVVYVESMPCLV